MQKKSIGEIIREHRLRKSMTQDALAAELHVSPQAVSRWETGQTTPDINLLMPLSRLLEIGVNELLGGDRRADLEQKLSQAVDLDMDLALFVVEDALLEYPDDEGFLYDRVRYEYSIAMRMDEANRNHYLWKAITHGEDLIQRFPDNDDYKSLLAHCFFAFGQKQSAMRVAYSIQDPRSQHTCIEELSEGDEKICLQQKKLQNMLSNLLWELRSYRTRESITAAYALFDAMAGDDPALRGFDLWQLCLDDALLCLDEGNVDGYAAKLTETYEIARAYDALPHGDIPCRAPLFDHLTIQKFQRYVSQTNHFVTELLSKEKPAHPASAELRRRIVQEALWYGPLHKWQWQDYYRFCKRYICKGNFFNFSTAWHVPFDEEKAKYNALIQPNSKLRLKELNKDEVEQYVKSGVMRGYVARLDETIVAYCHCGKKESFERSPVPEDKWAIPTAPDGAKVLSIVEFLVPDNLKGCGLMEKLLDHTLNDAKKRGYTHAEVYPLERMAPDKEYFEELLLCYEQAGFTVICDLSSELDGKYYVMQKEI